MDIQKKAMIEALEKSLGVVTTACKLANIVRQTHYNWLKEDPEYKTAVDSIQDIAIDFAESKLFELVKDKDTTATIFYLKTKGKNRGYVERQEVTGADGAAIKHEMKVDLSKLSDDELERLAEMQSKLGIG